MSPNAQNICDIVRLIYSLLSHLIIRDFFTFSFQAQDLSLVPQKAQIH